MKILLKDSNIVDGTGQPSFEGSVIVEREKIAEIIRGAAPIDFDGKVIDCTGLTVAPGFIDAHSHNDWFAARQDPIPFFKPFAEQGIATQVVGNCGFSPFGYEAGTPHQAPVSYTHLRIGAR